MVDDLPSDVREWLVETLSLWADTWECEEEENQPYHLLYVVELLRQSQDLTTSDWKLIMFHMWQKYAEVEE